MIHGEPRGAADLLHDPNSDHCICMRWRCHGLNLLGGGDSGQLVTMGSRGRVSFFFQELLVFCVMISALLCKKKNISRKWIFPDKNQGIKDPQKRTVSSSVGANQCLHAGSKQKQKAKNKTDKNE